MGDWQPIETAPKDGTPILAMQWGNALPDYETTVYVCKWISNEFENIIAGYDCSRWHEPTLTLKNPQPTHWIPIPPAPEKTRDS